MRRTQRIRLTFAIVLGLAGTSPAQDSLHLVMTLTGDSFAERITGAVGVGDVNGDGYYDFAVSRLETWPKSITTRSVLRINGTQRSQREYDCNNGSFLRGLSVYFAPFVVQSSSVDLSAASL